MKISDYLSQQEVSFYTSKKDTMGLWVLFSNWLIVFTLLAVAHAFPNPLVILACVILLGGRQLGLATLMHECGHGLLFKTKSYNQQLGHWLCANVVLFNQESYALGHLQHHKLSGTDQDPDLRNYQEYPVEKTSLKRKIIRDLTGQTGFKLVKALSFMLKGALSSDDTVKEKLNNPVVQIFLTQLALLVIFSMMFSPWAYLLWVVSYMTVFMALVRIRQIAEHANVPDLNSKDSRDNTRTTIPKFWERLIFAPNWVNYHLEHHYIAGVPCYRLKELHQLLKARGAYNNTEIFHGYSSVLKNAVV